jgi:mRNA interferase HigB
MRVITWKKLREFAETNPHALEPLKVWRKLVEVHAFLGPADVKRVFGAKVDFLPDGIVVFDIGGNKFRISANIRYRLGRVFVREVMTHAEYDRRTRKGTP